MAVLTTNATAQAHESARVRLGSGYSYQIFRVADLLLPAPTAAVPVLGRLIRDDGWGNVTFLSLYGSGDPEEVPPSATALAPSLLREELELILTELVAPKSWLSPAAWDRPCQGALEVVQQPKVLAQVGAAFSHLRRTLAPRFELDVWIFDTAAVTVDGLKGASGVVRIEADRAAELQRALVTGNARGVLQAGTAEMLPRQGTRVGQTRRSRVIYNAEAVYGSGSRDYYPQVRVIQYTTGLHCSLRPTPSTGLALFGILTRREPGPVLRMPLLAGDQKEIEKISYAESQALFSLIIEPGDGLLMAPGGTRFPNLGLFLRVRTRSPTTEEKATFTVIPTGQAVSSDWLTENVQLRDSRVAEQSQRVAKMLGDAETAYSLQTQDGVVMGGSREFRRWAQRHYLAIARDRTKSYVLTLTREARTPGHPWRPHGKPQHVVTLGHRSALLLQGATESFVGDYNMEGSMVFDLEPAVRTSFDGTQLRATVHPGKPQCRVELNVVESARYGSFDEAVMGTPEFPMTAPRTGVTRIERTLWMAPGETRLLGRGPDRRIQGRVHATRLHLTLRKL